MTTETDIITRWKKSVEFFEALRYAAATNASIAYTSKSLLQLTDEFEAMLGGTQFAGVDADFFAVRRQISAALQVAARTFGRHVLDYKEVAAADMVGEDFGELWAQLYRYYAENAKRVSSRGFVFGDPTAGGSNAGDGDVFRCNVDAFGFTLENQTDDAKLLRCEKDSTTDTNVQEEEFSIRSTSIEGRDALEEVGSGKIGNNITALSARRSLEFGILNPSFSTSEPAAPTAAPTTLGGWESNVAISGTTYEVVNDYYRAYFGDTAPMALRCKSNAFILSQTILAPRFKQDRAYYRHVAWRRKSSADGTLKFRLGRAEVTVNIASGTNDVWNLLQVTDEDAWCKNFAEEGITIEIERSGGSTGSVDIDDVTVGEFSTFDGGYYAIVGGPDAFQIEDTFTFTDAKYATDGIVQSWLWRVLGLYLPSCPTVPTTAPTAVLAGVAGNVDNGAHSYRKVWVDSNGIESPVSGATAVTVVDKTSDGKVTVGRVDASPGTHIVFWRIYRSKAGTTTPLYLLTNVAIGTATYLDNTADASLPTTTSPTHTVFFPDP